jgi:hypothetical protein
MTMLKHKQPVEEFPDEGALIAKEASDLEPVAITRALSFPLAAKNIVIKDEESLVTANNFRNDIRAIKAEVEKYYDPLIDKAEVTRKAAVEGKKSIVDKKDYFWNPLDYADRLAKSKISDYLAEQDRIRLAAEREKRRAEEEARQIADKAADEAYELAKNGDFKTAEKIVDAATEKAEAVLASPPEIPEKIKLDNFRERTQWWAEVIEPSLIPQKDLLPDVWEGSTQQKKFDAMARVMKDQMRIPGVVARSRKI